MLSPKEKDFALGYAPRLSDSGSTPVYFVQVNRFCASTYSLRVILSLNHFLGNEYPRVMFLRCIKEEFYIRK